MFTPHPNLSDEVNANIVQSEIEGGVSLGDLPPSTVLEIQTQHHRYTAVFLGEEPGADFRAPGRLPGAGAGGDCGFDLGRVDAEAALHRSRHASGVLSSRVPELRLSLPAFRKCASLPVRTAVRKGLVSRCLRSPRPHRVCWRAELSQSLPDRSKRGEFRRCEMARHKMPRHFCV